MRISRRQLRRLIENYVNESPVDSLKSAGYKEDNMWDFEDVSSGLYKTAAEKAAKTFLTYVQHYGGGNDAQISNKTYSTPDGDVYAINVPNANMVVLVGAYGAPDKIHGDHLSADFGEEKNGEPLSDLGNQIYNETLRIASKNVTAQSGRSIGNYIDISIDYGDGNGYKALFINNPKKDL